MLILRIQQIYQGFQKQSLTVNLLYQRCIIPHFLPLFVSGRHWHCFSAGF